jgi:hypothetical protein
LAIDRLAYLGEENASAAFLFVGSFTSLKTNPFSLKDNFVFTSSKVEAERASPSVKDDK